VELTEIKGSLTADLVPKNKPRVRDRGERKPGLNTAGGVVATAQGGGRGYTEGKGGSTNLREKNRMWLYGPRGCITRIVGHVTPKWGEPSTGRNTQYSPVNNAGAFVKRVLKQREMRERYENGEVSRGAQTRKSPRGGWKQEKETVCLLKGGRNQKKRKKRKIQIRPRNEKLRGGK